MNVVVVGGGAMGAYFSAIMDKAGANVSVLDVSETVVDAINTNGVTLQRDGAETHHDVQASTTATGDEADLVLFVVKAHHTQSAARGVARIVGEDPVVATLQNGWGNATVISNELSTHGW